MGSDFSLFGRRLRERRKALGLSQAFVGAAIGINESCSRARISRYETGVHEPTLEISRLIAQALSVPLGYFYCEDDLEAEALLHIHAMNKDQRSRVVAILRASVPKT